MTRLKDGRIAVNEDFKLSGRSVYLCRSVRCLVKARDRKGKSGLEYALKTQIPPSVWADLEKIINQP